MKIHIKYVESLDSYFLLESAKWTFTENVSDAEIVVLPLSIFFSDKPDYDLYNKLDIRSDQIILLWIFETSLTFTIERAIHMVESSNLYQKYPKILIAHTNALYNNDHKFIHFDIMFNRQKLYFTDYQEHLCKYKAWAEIAPSIVYSINPIDKKFSESNKLFLAPIRIKQHMCGFEQLKKTLKDFLHKLDCLAYINDLTTGEVFYPNMSQNLSDTEKEWINNIMKTGNWPWLPVSDHYYNTSYITLGIESDYTSSTTENFYVSEKYYNQLIKGNFPLIYGAPNQVKYLKEIYGFKFPEWIDYSYDSIKNDATRLESYFNSIKQISKISIQYIHELYLKDKHILDHNRNIFFQRPYDSIYSKVSNAIERLGW